MEFKNEKLGASFSLPDKITVRMQLTYISRAALAQGTQFFEKCWEAAAEIMNDWKCEALPDPRKLDLDEVADPKVTETVIWAGMAVKEVMDNLDRIPKN